MITVTHVLAENVLYVAWKPHEQPFPQGNGYIVTRNCDLTWLSKLGQTILILNLWENTSRSGFINQRCHIFTVRVTNLKDVGTSIPNNF